MKLLQKTVPLFSILILIIILTACGSAQDENQQSKKENTDKTMANHEDQNKEETIQSGTDNKQKNQKGNNNEEMTFSIDGKKAFKDQGDLNVWLEGNIQLKNKKFIAEGKTNLMPGSDLYFQHHAPDGVIIGGTSKTKVKNDGTFRLKASLPEDYDSPVYMEISFKPSVQFEDEIQSHYSEDGKKLKGDFVRLYSEGDGVYKKISFRTFIENPNKSKTIPIKAPQFEKPKKYGDPTIKIEPSLSKTKKYVYVKGETNLLEGTWLRVQAIIPNYITSGFVGTGRVQPDGTFLILVENPMREKELKKNVSEYKIKIGMNPSGPSQWNHVRKAYGKHGQKLSGEFVEKTNDGKKIELILHVKTK